MSDMIRVIGSHRVRCGSVMDSAGIATLMADDKADLIYSDPPWGMGNLKFWRTMAKKMTGQDVVQAESLVDFLGQIFTVAKTYLKDSGMLLMEYGVQWEDELKAFAAHHGFHHLGRCTPKYGGQNLPYHLHLFCPRPGVTPPDEAYFRSLEDVKGLKVVLRAAKPYARPGGVVFDMCCGMGYSAAMAMTYDMRFIGNELNSARLAVTIKRLEQRIVTQTP